MGYTDEEIERHRINPACKNDEIENKTKRIVVMGGSFNPPTLAHYILMREALDMLYADMGIFVPVSDAYLRRKMSRHRLRMVLTPELRVRMLKAMCTDPRMTICENEIGTIEPRTVPTLKELQREHPQAALYFLMGSDKLDLLKLLTKKRGFLDLFNVVLFSRGASELEETIRQSEILSPYLHRIVIQPQPDGTDAISSSAIRERMWAGIPSHDILCPGVWELFKALKPNDFPEEIDKFKGEYDFLSNRYACEFEWEGLRYANADAAFQASKCDDISVRRKLCGCSAAKAAAKGSEIIPSAEWEARRLQIMESILSAKFGQNPELMERLKATSGMALIHGAKRQEPFWGVDLYSWQGENHLGKILMAIRDKAI